MAIIVSPNMNLPVPVVGQELGPQYATDVNNCMFILDNHNHTPGLGVQIPPSGLNINSTLTFMNNQASNLKSTQFFIQSSPLAAAAPNLGALYVSGVDLYYNDYAGNQIRVTQSGGVAGPPGSITNLTPPASATYVSGNSTFVWQSGTNIPAGMDNGPVTIREIAANAKGITIQSPTALANDYSLTMPGALPGSPQLLEVDSSGNISFSTPPVLSVLGTSTTFNSGGTYTVPTGINYLRVVGCGGGGGGSGAFSGQGGGGGGGAGVFEGVISVVPGEILTIVVGTGGAGSTTNTANPNIAGNGTDSSVTGSISGLLLVMPGAQGAQGGPGGNASPGVHNGSTGSAPIFAGSGAGGNGYLIGRGAGNGGTAIGDVSAGGGGSIGVGGDKGTKTPLVHPTAGGIGAGGGGQDGTAGYFDTGGSGGNGQVTIYVQ